MAKRAPELHFAETETVAETVRGAGEFFELRAALGVEQIELFAAMSQAAEADSEQPDSSFHVAMEAEKLLEHRKNVGIELRRFPQRLGACVRFESGVANRQRKRPRGEAGFAEALAGFLRKMTEHGGENVHVAGILAESVIVRDGFRLCIDYKFVRIAAARLPIKRPAPLAEDAFQ